MKKITLAVFGLFFAGQLHAEETAAFLKLGVGARALGMGGAYTAIADDSSSLFWNQAGLSRISKRELGMSHAELPAQTRYDFLGYVQPTKYGTLGVGGTYLSQGSLEGRDASGKPTGGYSASDSAFQVALSRRLGDGSRLGVGVKYVRSAIADASAQTFAVDFGAQHELGLRGPGTPLFGVSVQNLGPGLKFQDQTDSLPLTLAAGLGYRLPMGLTAALDYRNRPHSASSEFRVGTEYALVPTFALRAGFSRAVGSQSPRSGGGSSKSGSGGLSEAAGFAAGFGFKVYGYMLDYSMTPFGELGHVQRFSLGARF